MALSAYRASASEPLLFYLGAGSGWIFYVFDEAGVLYASGNPSIGTAVWDLAGEGERFAGIRVPRREDFLLGPIRDGCAGFDSRSCSARIIETPRTRR